MWYNEFVEKDLPRNFNSDYEPNPERYRNNSLLRTYGMSQDEYQEMLDEQRNCCAICLEPFKKTPHIDHDHENLHVRGILCSGCNTGLGSFKDDSDRLRAAADYLDDRT